MREERKATQNFSKSFLEVKLKTLTTFRECEMERSSEQCCGLHQLRQHEQRHQWCHQQQEASTCAAGAVAVVALTAANISSN